MLELLPAIIFLFVNIEWGLVPATAAVMLATVVAVGAGLAIERRVPILAIVTLFLVLALGGASLVLDDETFIKIKPTIGKCLFATSLGIGLLFRPSFLARALEGQVTLTHHGWNILTFCWIAFALALAGANELIWRTMDTDTWATFKAAMTPVSIVGYITITRVIAPFYWQELSSERKTEN